MLTSKYKPATFIVQTNYMPSRALRPAILCEYVGQPRAFLALRNMCASLGQDPLEWAAIKILRIHAGYTFGFCRSINNAVSNTYLIVYLLMHLHIAEFTLEQGMRNR